MNYKYSKHGLSKIGKEQAEFICSNYGNLNTVELANILNVKSATVSRCLLMNGIEPHSIKKYKDVMCELYEEGKSTTDIADIIGCSITAVLKTLKSSNVKIRSKSERQHRGARWEASGGYIIVTPMGDDKRFLSGNRFNMHEHRLVMCKHLNRQLLVNENVHHINGDRKDNSIENLELWSTSQPSGQRVCDKIRYAKEILALYEGDFKNGLIK